MDAAPAPSGDAAAAPPRPLKHQLVPPATLPNGVQYSIHAVPRAFARELGMVLPDVPLEGVVIVPTFQRAALDLVNIGPDVAREKDALLERFFAWASRACAELEARGLWGDYVDPCSGYAVRTPRSRVVYPEVDACETLLRYRTYNAGGCKVLTHPAWGTAVYPATLFARGDPAAIVAALEVAAAAERGGGGGSGAAAVPAAAPGGTVVG